MVAFLRKPCPLLAREKQIRDESTADDTISTAFHTNVAKTTVIKVITQTMWLQEHKRVF
jgi:hypothetical protein